MVFQFNFSGVTYTAAMASGIGGWTLIGVQATALNTDQIIINAAIVYANGLGGGSVYVEGSTYTLGATITMLASVYLYGVGENTLITGAGNFHLITINGVDDCTVEMLKLSHTLAAGNFECISIDESDRFYIRRVRIIDSPRFGIGGTGLTTMTDGWVVDCHIDGTGWEGIIFFMTVANLITNLFIMGNYITNTGAGSPIGVSGTERPLIANNITEGTGGSAGIYVNLGTSSIVADNIIDDNTGAGIFIDGGDNASVTGNSVFSSSGQGIRADNLENSVFDGNAIYEAVTNGFFLQGCVNNSVTDSVVQGCGDDGLELDADCDFNQIHGNNFISNTGFGINITAGATENDVRDNYYSGNVSGPINDLGTDTRLAAVPIPLVQGTTFISTAAEAWGWEIDHDGDFALGVGWLPLGVQQVVRIRVIGVGLAAPGAATYMRLQITGEGATFDEVFTTEPIDVVDKNNAEVNFAIDDVINWVFTATDDTDIGHLLGGDRLQIKVLHEGAAGDGIATNAVIDTIQVEYV